jgi:transposase
LYLLAVSGRSEVEAFFAALPPTLVGVEACGTAHALALKDEASPQQAAA